MVGWTSRQMSGWVGRVDKQVGGWVDRWENGWVDVWADEWMSGWMRGWVGGWVDRWVKQMSGQVGGADIHGRMMDGWKQHILLLWAPAGWCRAEMCSSASSCRQAVWLHPAFLTCALCLLLVRPQGRIFLSLINVFLDIVSFKREEMWPWLLNGHFTTTVSLYPAEFVW